MSVRTEADEKLEKAKDDIGSAILHLCDVVYRRVSGSEDYSKEYRGKVRLALNKLEEVSELLS